MPYMNKWQRIDWDDFFISLAAYAKHAMSKEVGKYRKYLPTLIFPPKYTCAKRLYWQGEEYTTNRIGF